MVTQSQALTDEFDKKLNLVDQAEEESGVTDKVGFTLGKKMMGLTIDNEGKPTGRVVKLRKLMDY